MPRPSAPRLDPKLFPSLTVASGALVDNLGRRLEEIDPDFVDELLSIEPRRDFAEFVAAAWRREARAVPRGRAAIAEHLGGRMIHPSHIALVRSFRATILTLRPGTSPAGKAAASTSLAESRDGPLHVPCATATRTSSRPRGQLLEQDPHASHDQPCGD